MVVGCRGTPCALVLLLLSRYSGLDWVVTCANHGGLERVVSWVDRQKVLVHPCVQAGVPNVLHFRRGA